MRCCTAPARGGRRAQSVALPGIGTLLVQPLFSLSAAAGTDGETRFGLGLPGVVPGARGVTLYA